MTNIWADTFSEIRELSLQEKEEKKEKDEKKHKEGPAEEKAEKNGEKEDDKPKRWWDDDGDGKGYEKGEVEGKFPKKKINKEEVEKLDEIDSSIIARTAHKRAQNLDAAQKKEMGARDVGASAEEQSKRGAETSAAAAKVSKHRALSTAHARSRSRMSKEERELDENRAMARDPEGRKSGYSKQPDPSKSGFTGVGNMSIAQIAKMSAKIKKEKETQKEERELSSKTNNNEKLDVRKGIKNKVNTKPTVTEELEAWIGELLDEGYDLSSFTLEEVAAIYESVEVEQLDEVDTYGMPPKGDAERQKADPMSAVKAKAARAKVAKERADLQVANQSQRLKVSTTESVLAFVSGRTPLFEARFDPKKSKLRPSSERTKSSMTDAQRKSEKAQEKRTAEIHSKGETLLVGLTSSGKKGKVKTTPEPKSPAPEANRQVKGKYDKLGKAADSVLKNLKDK
jgi:hypothetical protein